MKVTPKEESPSTVKFKTKTDKNPAPQASKWWIAKTKSDRCQQLLGTFNLLKQNQNYRYRQAAIYARLYGNMPLMNFVGGTSSVQMDKMQGLPVDRPTFNIVQSCIDTLVSRIGQSRPTPVYLTDGGDSKQRKLSKQLNNFILGEFYQTKTYEKGVLVLRDALVEGTGVAHVYRTADDKVGLERVFFTELFVDPNESLYGEPRQLYRMKLVDREVLKESFPDYAKEIAIAEQAYPDSSADASKSISDLVMVVEGWHLPSGKDSGDGRHTIACSGGTILDEEWNKERFPFVFLHYTPRLVGFWAQGLAEQLMPTQVEINRLLITISRSINLMGVPRVLVEKGSKISKAHIDNQIGSIVEFAGTPPQFLPGDSGIGQDIYAQLQRLIDYGYQQSGVSQLQSSSEKPAGLNSGEAIRSYNDISNDRFATLAKRFDDFHVDLAYLITDTAVDIANDTGKYQTIYPNKDGTKEIDLPKLDMQNDPFVIQCYTMSSLPKDPAGRLQKVSEMITSGMLSIKEGRRLLDYPDLTQNERLANAAEERILQVLDSIVEDGDYTPPDSFMDLMLAKDHVVAYVNLYGGVKMPEERMEMLRTFYTQVLDLSAQASAPPTPGQGPGAPPMDPAAAGSVPAAPITAPPAQLGINSAA